jgi:LPS-assembly protein
MLTGLTRPTHLFITPLLLFSSLTSAATVDFRTAAEIDWRPLNSLNAVELKNVPFYCHGAYVEPPLRFDTTSGLMRAEADDALHIMNQSTTLTGGVVLNQGTQEIRSPRIVQDEISQMAEIDGPLQLRDQGLLLTGEHATSNLLTGEGTVDQATFLLHESSFRGNAATLKRNGSNQLFLDDTTFTRCDPGSNTWSMNSETLVLKPDEGYGTARNVTLRIKNIPVIYTPYLRFPLNDERQSGFLLPSIGHDSDGGTDIIIPYYFNLAPDYDATYQLRSLWKRGLVHDLQARHMSLRTNNEINMGFIRKDDDYDDRDLEDLTSTGVNTGVVIPDFEKQDRWYTNLRHEGGWSPEWKTSLDYSAVSDIDYVEDIGGEFGSTSIDDFLNPVRGSLTEQRSASLTRLGSVAYRAGDFKSSLNVQGFQSLDPLGAEQYERLPNLTAGWERDLGPIESEIKFDYTFFDKDNTDLTGPLATIGERAYADLEVAWPYRKIWGFIKPAAGVIHRKYQLDDEPLAARSNPEITTGRFSLDGGLYFDRYFDFRDTALQQTLEPRVFYLYVENDFQDDLPEFDAGASTQSYSSLFRNNRFSGFDRIGDAERISVGVTSRFLAEETGSEFLSVSLGQIYYLKDRDVVFQPTTADDLAADESPLFAEARFKLGNDFSVSGGFEWEPDVNRSNRGTFALKYTDGLRRIVNVNYTYTASEIQQPSLITKSEESDINMIWPLTQQWSAIARWNFGWDDNRTIEAFGGLEYNDCCWKTRLVWRRFLKDPRSVTQFIDDPTAPGGFIAVTDLKTPSDVGIFFEFQLKGLAMLGGRLDSFLEDAIPGYREREDVIGL